MANVNVAYFVGVDVGTGSVRAALVSEFGKIVTSAVEKTKTWNVQADFYEQSTEDIWNAVVRCIKETEFKVIHYLRKGNKYPNKIILPLSYKGPNPINDKKKNFIQLLPYINKNFHELYRNLLTHEDIPNILPETDSEGEENEDEILE